MIRSFSNVCLRGLCLLLVAPSFMTSTAVAAESNDTDYIARMAAEHATDTPVASPIAQSTTDSEGATVAYAELGETTVTGYLAEPNGETQGGLIVIHEWWGLNDNIRSMARQFATAGYTALAVDLYEGEVATDRDGARALMSASMDRTDRLVENLGQAIAYLKQRGVEKIGVIGWCFGGGWSLQTALAHAADIDATVIYYGRLVTEAEQLAALASPVLGIFGGLDQGIPVSSVDAFRSTLASLDKPASIHVYDEADHAFANPSGTRYRKADAEDAWSKTLAFFSEHLK